MKGINNFISNNKNINTKGMIDECNDFEGLDELKYQLKIEKDENIDISKITEQKKITIYLNSIDQKINFSVSCFNTDFFKIIEEKILLKFPDLKDKDIFYLANGSNVNKKLTLEENKIKDGSHILINYD